MRTMPYRRHSQPYLNNFKLASTKTISSTLNLKQTKPCRITLGHKQDRGQRVHQEHVTATFGFYKRNVRVWSQDNWSDFCTTYLKSKEPVSVKCGRLVSLTCVSFAALVIRLFDSCGSFCRVVVSHSQVIGGCPISLHLGKITGLWFLLNTTELTQFFSAISKKFDWRPKYNQL